MTSLYHFGNARSDEQRAEMQRLENNEICMFCPEHLADNPAHQTLLRTEHWTVTPNRFPYQGTVLHLLLVPDAHVTDLMDLSDVARHEFWSVLRWVREHYELRYYGLGIRNGDPKHIGGTIRHLHMHVVVGRGEPVRMKFSS